MATKSNQSIVPQFRVEGGGDGLGIGTKVFFGSHEVTNVTSVRVENAFVMDDAVRSRLVIELCEPVPVLLRGEKPE